MGRNKAPQERSNRIYSIFVRGLGIEKFPTSTSKLQKNFCDFKQTYISLPCLQKSEIQYLAIDIFEKEDYYIVAKQTNVR